MAYNKTYEFGVTILTSDKKKKPWSSEHKFLKGVSREI